MQSVSVADTEVESSPADAVTVTVESLSISPVRVSVPPNTTTIGCLHRRSPQLRSRPCRRKRCQQSLCRSPAVSGAGSESKALAQMIELATWGHQECLAVGYITVVCVAGIHQLLGHLQTEPVRSWV